MEGRLPATRDVISFLVVAEAGSFHSAAQRLNLTVSALSHRIRGLEEEMDVALFSRHGRGIRLTAAGLRFRQDVAPIVEGLRTAVAASQRAGDDMVLRIASFQLFHSQWLVPRLHRFRAIMPDAKVELLSLRSRQTQPDIVVQVSRSAELSKNACVLCPFLVSPLCHRRLMGGQTVLSVSEFLKLPFIMPNISGDIWSEWAAECSVPWQRPKNAIVVDNLPLTLDLVEAGEGVALLAGRLELHPHANLCRPLPDQWASAGWLHVNPATEQESRVVVRFRQWLLDEIKEDLN